MSLVAVVLFVPVLSANVHLLNGAGIVALWLITAAVDPCFEEGYWRGALLGSSGQPPSWPRLLYMTFWWGLSHPLILGPVVPTLASVAGFIGTVFTGLVWSISFRQTQSLRWPLMGHVIVDLVSLTPLVLSGTAVLPQG